jgi:hypothetical protein
VTGVVAAALVVAAGWLPVWEARLSAPQYPDGLRLTVYSDRIEGDIREIDELNHYVGLPPFDFSRVPEAKLWAVAIALGAVGVAIGVAAGGRPIARLARAGLWLLPLGILADVQYRLYEYGHSVDPQATIRLDPFTPKVIGTTHVLNFTTKAYPGLAVVALAAAAFLLVPGPGLARAARRWLERRRAPSPAEAAT